jgi:lysine 2,3-aminomutase
MVTSHFASLAGPGDDDPIRRQFTPDPREAEAGPLYLEDPLGEAGYQVLPRLVHQYSDRVLLKTTGHCFGFCRYCFRRSWLAEETPFINADEAVEVAAYLAAHPEVAEILLSGGDPLTGSDGELEALFAALRTARPGILLRLCTHAPITEPGRLDTACIALLRRFRPLRLVVQVNHERELGGRAGECLMRAVDAGLPVHLQTVLLQGVNDDAAVLAALFRRAVDLGLSPYYLFQLDLAPGTAHFRVPLRRGLAIYEELRGRLSGIALPKYALDLPGGGGKVTLHEGIIVGEEETAEGRVYVLQGPDGRRWRYPAD